MSKETQKQLYAQRVAAGLCTRCSSKVEIVGKKKCDTCATSYRSMRKKIKDAGLCGHCLKNPIVDGYKSCQTCIDNRREEYDSSAEQTYRHDLRNRHKDAGLCITCANPHKTDSVQCQACIDVTVTKNSHRRMDRILKKLCVMCGKGTPIDGKITCELCIGKSKVRYIADIEHRRAQARINYHSRYTALKVAVYHAYGDMCKCCKSVANESFTLDHVNNDGNAHRDILSTKGGETMLRWIRDNDFPSSIQLLCGNCHLAKTRQLPCTHLLAVSKASI